MNIYVGNLSYDMADNELQELFEAYGSVSKATVIMDRETGRSKGFGFVEMDDSGDAEKAIEALDGENIMGRNLKVNQARPKENRPRRDNRESW